LYRRQRQLGLTVHVRRVGFVAGQILPGGLQRTSA
jgi:hypothetical protein